MTTLLSIKDVAKRLNVTTMTVGNLIKRKEIPAFRVGRIYRIEESQFELFLSRQTTSH